MSEEFATFEEQEAQAQFDSQVEVEPTPQEAFPPRQTSAPTLNLTSQQTPDLIAVAGLIPVPLNPLLPFSLISLISRTQFPKQEEEKVEPTVKKVITERILNKGSKFPSLLV